MGQSVSTVKESRTFDVESTSLKFLPSFFAFRVPFKTGSQSSFLLSAPAPEGGYSLSAIYI